MHKNFLRAVLLPACLPLTLGAALAQEPMAGAYPAQDDPFHSDISFAFSGGIGYRDGTAYEYVYSGGRKLSELVWDHEMTVVEGIVDVTVRDRLSVRASGWTKLTDGAYMDDFDWMSRSSQWTHHSWHEDTTTNHAFGLDGRIGYAVWVEGPFSVSPVAGWRYQNMKWAARGGNFLYSAGGGFRNLPGTFPAGQLGISYEQWMSTPYLGLSAAYETEAWSFDGSVIGSVFADIEDEDHHWMRNLRFVEKFDEGSFLAGRVAASYNVTPRFALGASLEYERYFETKGETFIYSITTGRLLQQIPGDSAGAAYEALTVGAFAKLKI